MMYFSTHTSLLCRGLVQQRLQLAQRKLSEPHTPILLKFSYYLRVCCAVIQKIEWAGWSSQDSTQKLKLSYAELVAAMSEHNTEWWNECYINEANLLQSDDPTIRQLLDPITALYDAGLSTIALPVSIPPRARIKPPTQLAV